MSEENVEVVRRWWAGFNEWAAIWTIRDGKVLRAQGYLNRSDAREAAGPGE
jgi:ketosteroid isomerase-like protein